MKKIKNCMRSTLAVFTVMAVIFSLILPSPVVKAEGTGDQQLEKIESFKATLEKGAVLNNGKYIWNTKTDADDHRFVFRVDYSMSGVKELEPGAIKIWIPKTILKDRSGKYADYMDLSIPSEDEYNSASEEDKKDVNYVWKELKESDPSYKDHENCIEITNVKQRTAGENGYFEVAYVTNEQTFEYKDEATYKDGKYVINETPQSDPFYADISVTNTSEGKPQTVTASTDKIPVYINTTAEISSTDKRYPNKMYREWQSSWGQQPDEAKGKFFLVWEIVSKIKKDPTQPFTFTLEDTPVSKELHLLGYSMGSQSGPFTTAIEKGNQVTGQRSDSDRYDYVLTYYDPTEFKGKDYYELKNSVKATVTPEDGIDAPTSANSSKVWEWDTPKFVHPTGHFYGEKYGDNNWHAKFGYYHDYSSYSLDKMQKKDINSIDTFRYYIDTYGYPLPWTRDGDADDPSSYGKKKVTYQLSDDELYLEDKITTKDVGTDQLEFGIPEGAHRLDSSDYQFLYADWNVSSQFRKYDDEEKKFVTDPSGKYSSEDVIHFWVKTNEKDSHDGEYKEVASYNLGSGKASISDSSIVKELTRDRITFKSDKDDPSVTGIRFTTSNAYYYTIIEAYPMVRLKNSDYVMKKLFKDENPKNVTENNCKSLIRLHNFAHSNVYQAEVDAKVNDNNLIYGVKVYAFDRAIRPKKESEIHKHIVSTGSNKVKKKYVIRWKITPRETLTTDSGTDYLVQDSGTFYDLLPKGTHLQKGSIDVETEKGMLSHSSFSYSVEEDYKGSGRDLIKVSVPVQAKYYNLYLNAEMSWDAIHDYGTKINNPVAYETGNKEIYNGYPGDDYVDSSGAVHKLPLSDVNKAYMTKLDPKCTTNRFIYDEEPHDIDTLTAAVSGLKKQIKDSHDASYSYETYTTTNGSYSYKIRFANTMTDKAKNLIFFDSLENYNLNGKHSDWHGFLKRFDVSQLKQKGIEPVIYVSKTADLSIDAHHDLTDNSVWQKVTESTDLSEMHAFAIDCRKTSDGKDFVLNQGESISAVVYMQAPASVSEVKGEYAKAYNNIYIQDTIMSGETSSDFFIHQDYTEIRYRVSADISIHKQSTDDESKSIEGAKYTLKGKSDYGTEVNEEVTTGKQGDAVFEGIEKGTYTLKESYSPIDWLLDRTEYTVKVDGAGKITCDGKEIEKTEKITLKDSPRIHGDISFMKYSTAGNNRAVTGAKFRLSGKSKYGTDVMEYATSDATGKVKFENIEWGSYKLKEVEAPDGYIPDRTEYTAVISDSGIGGIEDAEMLKTGSAVIRNEPYHTVEISKQSSYDNAPLSGAEFRLTGTSDYGTPYDKTATSGENGLAKFDGLEAGTYIIQETKSPKDYFLDSTKHIVKVNKDDTYTIDGLEKNDSHYYRMNNKPEENGKIIVKKKWKDTDETKRPTDPPVIHITTDINKVPTYAVWRDNRRNSNTYDPSGPFYYVDSDYTVKTKKVEYAKDITSADKVPASAVRLDKNYDDPNAKYKIWGWLDDGTMYYWTNAQTTRLTDGSNMLFNKMINAELIDLSKINTSEMTNMSYMFSSCKSLTSLDVSSFDTSKVTSMGSMFAYCSGLTSLDVSSFDTSNVTDMHSMFFGCSGLTSLDVSNWNTSKVTSMYEMFWNCSSLTSLDLLNFDTSKVTSMGTMFAYCSGLTSLDLSKFDTSNVTDMGCMFFGCSGLTSLDVSNWNTSKVTSMYKMFCNCSSLTNIYVSNKWNTDKVTSSDDMFYGCSKLPYYSSSSTDKAHANYGAGGYLTYKAYTSTAKPGIVSDLMSATSSLAKTLMSYIITPVHAADSASYVSTDKDHCIITKDGDTWTYEFKVADDSAKYYAYEESVEGYTSSNDVNSYGIVTKDEPLTITNTANELPKEPKPASLSLSKTADGKQLIEIDKPAEKYSHTSNIDDAGKATGTYSNNLSTNDIVTIPGASKLHVKLYYSTESVSWDWACVWAGSHPDYTAYGNYSSSKLGTTSGKIGGGAKTSMPATPIEGDIDGDTVTFGFRSDSSNNYYGYYAVVTDASYIQKTQPDGTQKWYQLRDTDVADIPSSYSDKAYMFDVTLKNSDSSKLSGTKIFGDAVFTDGKAEVGVKAGETKTFSGLPGGTTYTITEKKYDDFYTESKNASGTLNAGDNVEAKFTNHYQKPKTPDTPKEYSSFTLKKNVTGFFQSAHNYTFNVSFRKLDPSTEYSLSNGTKFTSDADGYGYVQTKLSDKGSVTFTSLPAGAQYRVTEEGGDWSSAYRITNSTEKGDIAQSAGSAEKNESLSTEWETADSGEGITVTYTNTVKKYQNLVLKKAVTGGKATEKFRFTVEFKKLYETVSSDAGTIVPDDDGNANVDIYLNAGDEIVFKNIPVNAEYKITEKANAGKASYTIRTNAPDGVAGGSFVKSADGNTEAMKDLSTAEETVDEGENATVTFLNDMPETTSVTLKKQVTGAFADRSKFFKFTVSLTGAEKKQSYSFDYTNGSSSHDGTKNATSITTDENGRGTADIWLKHNDTVVIKNIPLSAKYSIAEDPGEYVPSITINGEKADSVSERSAAPDVIVFTNTNTAVLPTGVTQHKKSIALVCTAIIALLTVAWYILKKRHKGENKAR